MSFALATERLTLRPMAERDEENWLALVNDPEVGRYTPPSPTATHNNFLAMLDARTKSMAEESVAIWAVEEADSGEFVGQCGLRRIKEADLSEVEVAYHYLPRHWGNGFATEAARASLGYGFGTVRLERIIGLVVPENVASWRVLENCGMALVGSVDYFGLTGLKKYQADRSSWQPFDASSDRSPERA
jgi:RimJ/RimL family protein N-acetyltransferase